MNARGDEVAPGIFRIPVPIPFDLREINVYLVDTGSGFLMIDTGLATDDAQRAVETALRDHGLDLADVTTILVTHFHPDHSGLAGRFRQSAEAPIVMSAADAACVARFFAEGPPLQPPELFVAHGAPEAFEVIARGMLPALTTLMVPFTVDRVIGTGDTVAAGRPTIGVLTPGHTPGHLTVFLPDEQLLFGGDHVLPHITPNIGLYETDDPNPLGSYLASLERVQRLGPRRIFPAHGPVIEDPEPRIAELLSHHGRRLDHVTGVTERRGSTAWDVATRVFGARPEPLDAWLAFFESLAHLEYLVHEGVLLRDEAGGRVVYVRR